MSLSRPVPSSLPFQFYLSSKQSLLLLLSSVLVSLSCGPWWW